jgi:hypothetical protein
LRSFNPSHHLEKVEFWSIHTIPGSSLRELHTYHTGKPSPNHSACALLRNPSRSLKEEAFSGAKAGQYAKPHHHLPGRDVSFCWCIIDAYAGFSLGATSLIHPSQKGCSMRKVRNACLGLMAVSIATAAGGFPAVAQQTQKPNILVIFGDDIGQSDISAYTFGLMGYHTPNIDRIAKEGTQSCNSGKPNTRASYGDKKRM